MLLQEGPALTTNYMVMGYVVFFGDEHIPDQPGGAFPQPETRS
jgi:hypothetical protein